MLQSAYLTTVAAKAAELLLTRVAETNLLKHYTQEWLGL